MDVMFVAPIGEMAFAEGNTLTQEIELAKTGTFKDPRYGKFAITKAHFQKWIANFKELSIADGRLGIPIDIDHSPMKKGETKAAGWVKSLRVVGDRLLGTVEWNELGSELVKDRQYAYISPEYAHDYKDEGGEAHGTMLVGAALTNRPFLRMATVSLSDDPIEFTIAASAAVEVEDEPSSDTHDHMPLIDDIKLKLGLAADADDASVLQAITTPAEQKTLDAMAKDEGKVVLDAEAFGKLTADATAGADAAKSLAEMRFDTAWTTALDAGKVVPAQKDAFKEQYDALPDSTLTILDALQPAVNVKPRGTTTGGSGSGEGPQVAEHVLSEAGDNPVDPMRAAIATRADAILLEKPSLSYFDAVTLAERELTGATA